MTTPPGAMSSRAGCSSKDGAAATTRSGWWEYPLTPNGFYEQLWYGPDFELQLVRATVSAAQEAFNFSGPALTLYVDDSEIALQVDTELLERHAYGRRPAEPVLAPSHAEPISEKRFRERWARRDPESGFDLLVAAVLSGRPVDRGGRGS